MARPKKQASGEVRRAMDGPELDHDDLIDSISARNMEDSSRASTAGESRQAIGEFLERTGMNAKAYSLCRTILKQKTTAKGMDIIRSLEAALPILKTHLGGNQSEMALDPVEPAPPGKPSYDADADFDEIGIGAAPTDADEVVGFGDEIAEETAAFEDHLAQVSEAAE